MRIVESLVCVCWGGGGREREEERRRKNEEEETLSRPGLFFSPLKQKNSYRSRLEVTCAIHSKLLKLSSAALAASAEEGEEGGDLKNSSSSNSDRKRAGDAVNLASSDVRRLDDAGVFWPFLLVAPLELVAVFALLATRLGPAAAAAGCAPLIAFVPGQAFVSRRIGALRAATAARTDARARAAAEAVNGALTVKMLAAGDAILRRLFLLRKAEETPIRRMAAIRVSV